MDNIDSLMSKISLHKPKKEKEAEEISIIYSNTTNLSTLASSPDSFEDNEKRFLSPKSPIFKPQQTPNDMMPDMLLPESEMDLETFEEPESEKFEINPNLKNKKRFSCPNATLNIWVGNSTKDNGGFEMIQENDADMFSLDSPVHKKSNQIKGFELNPSFQASNFKADEFDFKRVRSQSENITACTIFKFMEGSKTLQKRQF